MKEVFDLHCHYLFKIPLKETVEIFKEEFSYTHTAKACFLSIPQDYTDKGEKISDPLQNIKGMFLKRAVSPNGYAYAGLVHPQDYSDTEGISREFLKQVENYYRSGFDGIKMIEGYPTFIKFTRHGIDSEIYDKFYAFCEEKGFPITIHIANPDENWNLNKARKYAIEQGRVYDSSYPSKEEITGQTFRVLEKYPRLRMAVAHFGFFAEHYADAERFMSYNNTYLDITPGGEQLIYMSKNWDKWLPFWEKYQERIFYGSDYYAFPKDENWETCFNRRPKFLREFFETDTKHFYLDERFKGIKADEKLLDKIYTENGLKMLEKPKKIDENYFIDEISELEKLELSDFDKADLKYIKQTI